MKKDNKPKKYNIDNELSSILREPGASYNFQPFNLIGISRNGILKKTLSLLTEKLSFTVLEVAKVLHVSERTLQRYNSEDKLSPDISERALMLARLYERGLEVFENSDNFTDWLRTPLPAFNGQQPIQLLDTSFGFQLIFDELGRIEYGVFS
ncbi:MAG: type II RES/Xre toxin-antitoxin system antitoxin [Chitinophagaceae bacterium]